jgi:Isochorismatase family
VPELKAMLQRSFAKTAFDATQSDLSSALRPPAPAAPARGGNARSLPRHLQKPQQPAAPARNTIVLAGVEAHICLLQTALGLLEQEFEVWVVTDACTSRRERDRDAAFDRLAGNGVELVTSEMVIYEWLGDSDHPDFAEVLQLVK